MMFVEGSRLLGCSTAMLMVLFLLIADSWDRRLFVRNDAGGFVMCISGFMKGFSDPSTAEILVVRELLL